jgi:hypothetical protein
MAEGTWEHPNKVSVEESSKWSHEEEKVLT